EQLVVLEIRSLEKGRHIRQIELEVFAIRRLRSIPPALPDVVVVSEQDLPLRGGEREALGFDGRSVRCTRPAQRLHQIRPSYSEMFEVDAAEFSPEVEREYVRKNCPAEVLSVGLRVEVLGVCEQLRRGRGGGLRNQRSARNALAEPDHARLEDLVDEVHVGQ